MKALKITLNSKKICSAGVPGFCVVSAIVNWVRRRPEYSKSGKDIEEELTLNVGGFDSNDPQGREYVQWIDCPLKVGDRITVEVMEAEEVDEPAERNKQDHEKDEKAKQRYYERLKQEYGE